MTSRFKKRTTILRSIIGLLVATALTACNKQTVYHAFQAIPAKGWMQKDTLLFEITVPDSQTYYKIAVELRNRNTYPYRNIHIGLEYESPDATIHTDTRQFTLANEQGIWQGDGLSGLYESNFPIGGMQIGKAGKYTVKIVHLLPDSLLIGINDVGLKITR